MTTLLFLAILAATLAFGAYLGTRTGRSYERAAHEIDCTLAAFKRDRLIDDAADMAQDGNEREIAL